MPNKICLVCFTRVRFLRIKMFSQEEEMKRFTAMLISLMFLCSYNVFSQVVDFKGVSIVRLVEIVKAEDELRYDKTLESFMKHPNPHLRKRAALAAGRIRNEDAIPSLTRLLDSDVADVQQMAAFAIGEIESIKGADAILNVLSKAGSNSDVGSRVIEAAGKIAATDRNHEKSKLLGKAILEKLEIEAAKKSRQSDDVILLGITSVLRARPKDAESTVAKFLDSANWRIRADALNTLARLRAKNVNARAKELLVNDENPIVRANSARVLGAAADENSVRLVLDKALNDEDLRVRVNSIRALIGLKNKESAEKLIERAEKLIAIYKRSKYKNPPAENELLAIASTLGNVLKGTDNRRAIKFLEAFRKAEKHTAPEVEIALVRVSPQTFAETRLPSNMDWKSRAGFVAGLGEAVNLKEGKGVKQLQTMATIVLGIYVNRANNGVEKTDKSFPATLNAYAKYKPKNFANILKKSLKQNDVIVRSTAATLLGDIKPTDFDEAADFYTSLSNALRESRDDKLNDASLAILDALKKQNENRPKQTRKFAYMTPFISAMDSPDYLVRRKAADIYRSFNIKKPDPMTVGNPHFKPFEIPADIGIVKFQGVLEDGSKSRVNRTDYKKALSRKNGRWAAILKTEKGRITVNLFPEDAPLTVDNFIRLARAGYFNGLAIHRVVPNFVVQDGDPRGDGSGGPGWQIRCEINQIPYERGMVGMALAGKDTGGSQWFVTHSPQPHLDGGYTIFGKVDEKDMKKVDMLARGDKILRVQIVRK